MSYIRKFFNIALCIQIVLSIIILASYLSRSTIDFFSSLPLNEEEKKQRIYDYFYRSMMDYMKNIPNNENAMIIEPPGEHADFFWILNYYFLPRKIYTFPQYFLLRDDYLKQYNIKYIILTEEKGFYFKRYEPQKTDINIISPNDGDSLSNPPLFNWIPPCSTGYVVHLCRDDGEVLNTYKDLKITLKDRWLMPEDIWTTIPHRQIVFWYVDGIEKDAISKLMVFFKK